MKLLVAAVAAAALLSPAAADQRQEAQDALGAEVAAALAAHPEPGFGAPLPPQRRADKATFQPWQVNCPANLQLVRQAAGGISDGEKAYLAQRSGQINAAVKAQLSAVGLPTPPRTPVIGLALSGGGYRAMINGLGMTMATMSQSDEAKSSGVGGWLDGVSYMAGLSGGSWATGTFIANGGQLPTDLVHNVLNLPSNLVAPPSGKIAFYTSLLNEVNAKKALGFPTQITDYWALALGNHLLPADYRLGSTNGPNLTIDELPSVVPALQTQNAQLPLPIIITAQRKINSTIIPENATYFEFNPYEFGSWAIGFDGAKTPGYFTPVQYLGTAANNGAPANTSQCWNGFDQLTFAMGTSSTLFNYAIVQLGKTNGTTNSTGDTSPGLIASILGDIGKDKNDISQIPNPFANYTAITNPNANDQYLELVDGGETNQNVPLEPLLMPARNVDAILAFDNSADTDYSWPNGSSLWTTYNRAAGQNAGIRMPPVPSTNGFVNGGLNTRPVFFGCNNTDTPIVVYVPNYPWSFYSNSTTFTLAYENATAAAQMESTMRALTLNGTVPTWPKCLACALTDRSFGYTAQNRSSDCAQCFDTWCWNGVDDSSDPAGKYEPLQAKTPTFLVQNNLTTAAQTSGIAATATSKGGKKNAAGRSASVGGTAVAAAATVFSVVIGASALLL